MFFQKISRDISNLLVFSEKYVIIIISFNIQVFVSIGFAFRLPAKSDKISTTTNSISAKETKPLKPDSN